MMSGINLQEVTKTKYWRYFTDQTGFIAEIIMNPRDAMVFAKIHYLSEVPKEAVSSLEAFLTILTKSYGGKSIVRISQEALKKLPEGTLQSTKGAGRYLSIDAANKVIAEIREKQHVQDQLGKFTTGEYKFLVKDDLGKRAAELSEFKIKFSSFVNAEKIKTGQYSEKAEEEKLNNPYVEHYAIQHHGKIIACVMHVVHGLDTTYDSDFVVHPDYRSRNIHPNQLQKAEKNYPHGLSQALCVKVHDHLLHKYPQLKHSWLIAGGHGALGVGARLYDEIFPTQVIQNNPELQKAVGLYLRFDNPGYELLLAANRDPKTQLVNADESKYRDAALAIAAQSTELDLAAKQPEKKPVISPISVFTNSDKSPAPAVAPSEVAKERFTS